jgi:hypothetical protein
MLRDPFELPVGPLSPCTDARFWQQAGRYEWSLNALLAEYWTGAVLHDGLISMRRAQPSVRIDQGSDQRSGARDGAWGNPVLRTKSGMGRSSDVVAPEGRPVLQRHSGAARDVSRNPWVPWEADAPQSISGGFEVRVTSCRASCARSDHPQFPDVETLPIRDGVLRI